MQPQKELFGMVAVRKGFVTQDQVEEALHTQAHLKKNGQGHKLIGMVMLESGMLGTTELIHILKELQIHPTVADADRSRK